MAKGRERSLQSLYREAEKVVEAFAGSVARGRIEELQRQLADSQAGGVVRVEAERRARLDLTSRQRSAGNA